MMFFEDSNVFIHVPKVGGTTIRRSFPNIDANSRARIKEIVGFDPEIDLNHLTVGFLKRQSVEIWLEMKESKIYGLVRDPHERFFSSFAQYISINTDYSIENISLEEMLEVFCELEHSLIAQFSHSRELFTQSFIHFQPQVDFFPTNQDGVEVNLYTLDNIEALVRDLAKIANVDQVQIKRQNETLSHKWRIVRFLTKRNESIYKWLKRILPSRVNSFLKYMLFTNEISDVRSRFMSKVGDSFVDEYYSADIRLFASLK